MSLLFRGKAIFKPLNTGRIDARVACVREWVANIFFYTKNGTTVIGRRSLFFGKSVDNGPARKRLVATDFRRKRVYK